MKKIIIILFFTFFQKNLFAQNEVRKQIIASQNQRFEATTRQDSATLFRLLDDNLLYLHSNGLLETKQTHIQAIMRKKIVYQSFKTDTIYDVFVKRNTAIMNGKTQVKGLYEGKDFQVKLYYTAVFRRKNKNWRLMRWQSTSLK